MPLGWFSPHGVEHTSPAGKAAVDPPLFLFTWSHEASPAVRPHYAAHPARQRTDVNRRAHHEISRNEAVL